MSQKIIVAIYYRAMNQLARTSSWDSPYSCLRDFCYILVGQCLFLPPRLLFYSRRTVLILASETLVTSSWGSAYSYPRDFCSILVGQCLFLPPRLLLHPRGTVRILIAESFLRPRGAKFILAT